MIKLEDVNEARGKLEKLNELDTKTPLLEKLDSWGLYIQLTLQFVEELYVILKNGVKWYNLLKVLKVIKAVNRFIINIKTVGK